MDSIPSARMAWAPALSWVCALAAAGIVLTIGVLAVLVGAIGIAGFVASLLIAALLAAWGTSGWRRWSQGRQARPKSV